MRSTTPHIRSSAAFRLVASVVLVAGVWLAAVSRWVVSDLVVRWDSKNQFYAFFRFLSAALRAGQSEHRGPQSLVFNPVFALWGLLDPAPAMRTFDLCVFAHSLVGGISIAIIGWRARWPIPANVLAAALFMFGGASSGRLQHTGIIIIYAVFPLAFLLLQLALQRRSLLLAAGFAIIAADVGLGRNQVALLVCALLLAAAVAEILVSAQPLSYLRERSGVLATSSPAVAKDRQAASVPGARATNGAPSRRLQHRPDMAAASGRTSGHSDASVAGEQSPVRQRQCRELGKPTWRCQNRL